jgi:hypothetical protein
MVLSVHPRESSRQFGAPTESSSFVTRTRPKRWSCGIYPFGSPLLARVVGFALLDEGPHSRLLVLRREAQAE